MSKQQLSEILHPPEKPIGVLEAVKEGVQIITPLVAVRHSEESPVSREARKVEECSILQEIMRDHPSRDERMRA